jgi:hypothetical protein
MLLKHNMTEPGDSISIDQYTSTVLGPLPQTKGKEKTDHTGSESVCQVHTLYTPLT